MINNFCFHNLELYLDIFVLIRHLDHQKLPIHNEIMTQTIPFWTRFHCLLTEKRPDVNVVTYPPIIDAKPTDMSVVFTTMNKCLDMSMEIMINNFCFHNLELYLDIFVLIQPRRIEIYCNYLMLFTFELYLGFVTFR
jgi:hypothetical protein